jgi:hypothetical protein
LKRGGAGDGEKQPAAALAVMRGGKPEVGEGADEWARVGSERGEEGEVGVGRRGAVGRKRWWARG